MRSRETCPNCRIWSLYAYGTVLELKQWLTPAQARSITEPNNAPAWWCDACGSWAVGARPAVR